MHNPLVPESLEGWSVLHLMYRVRWDRLRGVPADDLRRMADEAIKALAVPDAGATAAVQMLGHKADLMFICFRRGFEQLAAAQLALSRTELHDHLEPTSSYVSIVELGMAFEPRFRAGVANEGGVGIRMHKEDGRSTSYVRGPKCQSAESCHAVDSHWEPPSGGTLGGPRPWRRRGTI